MASLLDLVPRLLVRRDEPDHVDAIVALGGDASGQRVDRAVGLLKQGWATTLVLSGGPHEGGSTWAEIMRERAVELGVQPEKIVLQDKSWSTAGDAALTTKILLEMKTSKAMIVTSSLHSARSSILFKCSSMRISWISCPVEQEWTGDWWRNKDVASFVFEELAKFVLMPLQILRVLAP